MIDYCIAALFCMLNHGKQDAGVHKNENRIYRKNNASISFVKIPLFPSAEEKLGLTEVHAPILNRVGDGTQDNLSGCEKRFSK
ncbi:hypothetical protein LAD77_00920 [Klebsiella pneumoniae]|nr:hypothetical protein [Klebsiella pneumoniae]